MKLHDLRPAPGSRRQKKRIGRGLGSGRGVTAGKGTKGQKAREGFKMIPGFEGGQIRMIKRLPHKRGFKNPWRVEYEVFNVGLLAERFTTGAQVDLASLEQLGLRTKNLPLKILGDGELGIALTVTAHKVSKGAREKIEAAGGSVTELGVKEVQAKKRPVTARDVTLREGANERTRVHARMKPRPSKQRAGEQGPGEGGEANA
jgi:large subunit ribosomal protein L15